MANVKNFRDLRSTRYVNVGEVVSVNYPKHGKRNVTMRHGRSRLTGVHATNNMSARGEHQCSVL